MNLHTQYIWQKVPLFRAIWPFIAGIIVGIFQPNLLALKVCIAIMAFGAFVLPIFRNHRWIPSVSFLLLFVVAGYAITVLNTERMYDGHYSFHSLERNSVFIGTLSSDAVPRKNSIKAEMDIHASMVNGDTMAMNGTMLVYFQKDSLAYELGYGDELVLKGMLNEISPPQNPNEFNYKRYMGFHQITHQIYAPSESWYIASTGKGFVRTIKNWQHGVLDVIESHDITDRELAIVSALLVGYKHHLSADQVNAFASAGAMHVLAVSGLHVGIIFLIVSSLLKPLERFKWGLYMKGILLLLALWLYAAITGLSPSVTRAATMFSFVIAAQQFKRHTNIFNTLATSAMALLILNPFLVVEVGFQLSYLAVMGIVVLQPYLYKLWEPKYWVVDKIWAITAVSVSAQVATFPLGLLYFHQFPNYFLLSNLVVIPAATLILPVGIALVAFHWVPLLNTALGFVLYWLVHLLDLFIQWVEKQPGALISGIDISIFETYFIYMIIVTSVAFVITRRYRWLIAFLVTFCAIEALNIRESVIQKSQQDLVIYRVKGHEAVDVISGHQHALYADSSLVQDFDKMRFHIHHHWWWRDLDEPTLKRIKPGFIYHDTSSVLVLDEVAKVPTELGDVDVLYVTARTKDHPKYLLDHIQADRVVLSVNLDWKTRNYWQQLLKERQIDYHDMRSDGAFVMTDYQG